MAARQIRIRLDFSDPSFKLNYGSLPESCWMLVDQNIIPNIQILKEAISSRFLDNSEKCFVLFLSGGFLPELESIYVLRDDDVVRLIPVTKIQLANKRKRISLELQKQSSSKDEEESELSTSLVGDCSKSTECSDSNSKKKKKKKESKIESAYKPNCSLSIDPDKSLCTPGNTSLELENSYTDNNPSLILENNLETTNHISVSSLPITKKRKRIRKRSKASPNMAVVIKAKELESYTVPEKASVENKSMKTYHSNKHIHFPENADNDNNHGGEIENGGCSVENVKDTDTDFKVQPTILPPTNKNFEEVCNKLLQRAKTESQENTSVCLINCGENGSINRSPQAPAILKSESEYQKLTPLKYLPRVGDVIAYKALELSDRFIPELSEYKEALVIDLDNKSETLTVEVKTGKVQRVLKGENGGYDTIIYDDVKNVTLSDEKVVKIQMSHLHEPKLVMPAN